MPDQPTREQVEATLMVEEAIICELEEASLELGRQKKWDIARKIQREVTGTGYRITALKRILANLK